MAAIQPGLPLLLDAACSVSLQCPGGSLLTGPVHFPRRVCIVCLQAFVVVGDSNGHVGLGVKCAKEVRRGLSGGGSPLMLLVCWGVHLLQQDRAAWVYSGAHTAGLFPPEGRGGGAPCCQAVALVCSAQQLMPVAWQQLSSATVMVSPRLILEARPIPKMHVLCQGGCLCCWVSRCSLVRVCML
jgi:hypothetical protein